MLYLGSLDDGQQKDYRFCSLEKINSTVLINMIQEFTHVTDQEIDEMITFDYI